MYMLSLSIIVACSVCRLTAGQDVLFSVFVSNSSILATTQVGSVIDETVQLSMVDATVMANQEFDTMCNVERAQTQLADEVNSGSIALIDGSCSNVAEDLSKTKNQTLMIIFSSTSAAINNNTVTMGTYRTIPSDRTIPPALDPLFRQYEWEQMSLVTASGAQYTELKRLIINQFNEDDSDYTGSVFEVDVSNINNINDSIEMLFNVQPHIYFLNTDIQTGIHFLCQGFTESRYYPNYLWILPGWWYQVGVASQWWDDVTLLNGTTCSNMRDVLTVLNMSLIMRTIPLEQSNIEDNEAQVFNTPQTIDYSATSYGVDAVLSLMVALNATQSPSAANYNDLTSAFNNVKFFGASGYVSYDDNGDRANTQVLIQQFIYDEQQLNTLSVMDIATIQNGSNFSYLNTSTNAVFPDGVPPDGTPIEVINVVKLGVTIFIVFLCFVGLSLTIICLLFNIIYKDKKIVKLSSPNLNYFLLFGVTLLLIAMIFYVIGTKDISFLLPICTLRRILVSIGHDIGFTVALVKTWRIHHIFKNPSPNKRAPKDWQLFAIAFLIVSIDLAVTVLLIIPDNIFDKVGFVKDMESSSTTNDQGVTIEYFAPACGTTPFYLVWIAFTTIFKMVLHIVAIILSFRIRSIVVDTLNDFKYTSIIVYTSTVLIVILIIVLVVAVSFINIYAVMVPLLVFLEVLVFLCFSFIPKMVALYKDPKGMHVFDKPSKNQNNSVIGDSLKRNVSLSYYNRKESTVKDDDSGRCTLDSKDQKEVNDQKGKDEDDNVFTENGTPEKNKDNHQSDREDGKQALDNIAAATDTVIVNGNRNNSTSPRKETDV